MHWRAVGHQQGRASVNRRSAPHRRPRHKEPTHHDHSREHLATAIGSVRGTPHSAALMLARPPGEGGAARVKGGYGWAGDTAREGTGRSPRSRAGRCLGMLPGAGGEFGLMKRASSRKPHVRGSGASRPQRLAARTQDCCRGGASVHRRSCGTHARVRPPRASTQAASASASTRPDAILMPFMAEVA